MMRNLKTLVTRNILSSSLTRDLLLFQLKTLLTIQNPLSPVHDEHLFIVVHQGKDIEMNFYMLIA